MKVKHQHEAKDLILSCGPRMDGGCLPAAGWFSAPCLGRRCPPEMDYNTVADISSSTGQQETPVSPGMAPPFIITMPPKTEAPPPLNEATPPGSESLYTSILLCLWNLL